MQKKCRVQALVSGTKLYARTMMDGAPLVCVDHAPTTKEEMVGIAVYDPELARELSNLYLNAARLLEAKKGTSKIEVISPPDMKLSDYRE